MDSALEEARKRINSGQATCVLIRDGQIVDEASGPGVKPILHFLEDKPGSLDGAEVADKIVGKAAAMLLTLGKAKSVHGEIMSQSAHDYLISNNISPQHANLIQQINNRTNTGTCPLELTVTNIQNPQEAYTAIKKTIAKLMAQG